MDHRASGRRGPTRTNVDETRMNAPWTESIQRFRAAFTHSDAEEIRDAMKNTMKNVAATKTKEGEVASKCMLELVWAAQTLLDRMEAGSLQWGKKINWLHITETDTTLMQQAAAEQAAKTKKPRKGARRLITALRAVLKEGNAKSMLDCAMFTAGQAHSLLLGGPQPINYSPHHSLLHHSTHHSY